MATQIVPLGYCDESDIQNFLMLDIDNSFSTQISTWIASAEKWVNNYLGYTTASGIFREEFTNVVEDTATIDSEGNLVIFPRKTPLVSVSSISLIKGTDTLDLDLADDGGNTRYNIPADRDMIVYSGEELSFSGAATLDSFFDLRYTKFYVKMSYIGGYESIPADIHMATVNVASDYIMRQANKEGLESVSQGGISKRWFQRKGGESDFIEDAKVLLAPYRISTIWIGK